MNASYLLRRLGLCIVQLFGLAVAIFFIVQLVPGDPVRAMLGERASEVRIEVVRDEMGLNDPLFVQLGNFLGRLLTGDLGTSYVFSQPIAELIAGRAVPSASLIAYGVGLSILIAAPLGVIAATRAGGRFDFSVRLFGTAAFAMPTFWIALMLALVFGLHLRWFPVSGFEPGLEGAFRTLTLPAVAMATALCAVILRILRSSTRTVLATDYIEAVEARGYSKRSILLGHVLRNAVTPTISALAFIVGASVGGTAVLERVFDIPGLGSLLIESVAQRDYPVIQVLSLVMGGVVILASLAADLIQAALDPRVRAALGAK